MKVSEFIKKLQVVQEVTGDLEVCTWDRKVRDVSLKARKDGIACPQAEANEVVITLLTDEWNMK